MVTTEVRDGQPVLRFWCNWFVAQDLDQPWENAVGWVAGHHGERHAARDQHRLPGPARKAAIEPALSGRAPHGRRGPLHLRARPGMPITADLPQILTRLS